MKIMVEAEKATWASDIEDLKRSLSDTEAELERLRAGKGNLESKFKASLECKTEELNKSQEEMKKMEITMKTSMEADLKNLQTEKDEMEKKLVPSLEREAEMLKRFQDEEKENEAKWTISSQAEMATRLTSITTSNSKLTSDITQLQACLKEKEHSLTQLKSEKSGLEDEKAALTLEIEQWKAAREKTRQTAGRGQEKDIKIRIKARSTGTGKVAGRSKGAKDSHEGQRKEP